MRRLATVLLAVLAVLACDSATGPDGPAGVYNMVTLGSKPLPHQNPGSSNTLLAASLTLRDDDTFANEAIIHYQGETNPRVEAGTSGTYVVTGDRIRLTTLPQNWIDEGTYTGDTITLGAAVYRR